MKKLILLIFIRFIVVSKGQYCGIELIIYVTLTFDEKILHITFQYLLPTTRKSFKIEKK